MKLVWDQEKPFLTVNGEQFGCSCRVRNEQNKLREASEIVYSMPAGKPYQPRPFPKGLWTILKPGVRSAEWLKPWFIPTDAYQDLPIWETVDGCYARPTDYFIRDRGYGLHYSSSQNTWGCCRIDSIPEINRLVALIMEARARGEETLLEVI